MENLILLSVFIMCLCGVFCVADLCIHLFVGKPKDEVKSSLFDYKLTELDTTTSSQTLSS